MATTADERLHSSLPQSQLMSSSISSLSSNSTSNSKLCSQTYKAASQLFLTRRLQEALLILEPIITIPGPQDDDQVTTSEEVPEALAPIATATSTVRIKTWNLYITLLSNIIDLGPEEGKKNFGQKEWKTISNKVKEGEIWNDIVRIGYRGLEGSVDADVVFNLVTLLLNHSSSQTLNQQRLETYLSAYGQPDLDIATRLENSISDNRPHLSGNGGTDTPKDLNARVKIIELFTLHVLPRNEEWDYAREFIRLSEVLDEERKDAFLQTLDEIKEEKERGELRAAALQREQEAALERQEAQEQERRKAEALAIQQQRLQQTGHRRISSEVDYGIEKIHPNGGTKPRASKLVERSSSGKGPSSSRTTLPSSAATSSSSRAVKKVDKLTSAHRLSALMNIPRNIFQNISVSLSGNPMAFFRMFLFMLGILMALSRQDIRQKFQRIINSSWQKVKKTIGMGVKVSYI